MPTRNITIEVIGLDKIQLLNAVIESNAQKIAELEAAFAKAAVSASAFASAVGATNPVVKAQTSAVSSATQAVNQHAAAMNQLSQATNKSSASMLGSIGTMLKYRAVSFVFAEVTQAVGNTIQAYADLERQTARISRVLSSPTEKPVIRASIGEEITRTGAPIKEVGEAFYQAGTIFSDTATRLQTVKTAMDLVIGTEGDARTITRTMIQIYEQFGGQLDKTASQAENMRRIGEVMAVTFKTSAAETSELANALKYVGPIAESAKIPLEQITGVVSALSAAGVRGRMAGSEIGQFIAGIAKSYDEKLGGIVRGGKLYSFEMAKILEGPNKGGIDLYKTIENIVAVANTLPTSKAREFLEQLTGTQQSFRFIGAQGKESLEMIRSSIEKVQAALKGQTNEAEKMKDQMMTTAQEFQRVWSGAMTALEGASQHSGLRDFLHGIAQDYQAIAQAAVDAAEASQRVGHALTSGPEMMQLTTQRQIVNTILSTKKEASADGINITDWRELREKTGLTDSERNWFLKTFNLKNTGSIFNRFQQGAGDIPEDQMKAFISATDARIIALRTEHAVARSMTGGASLGSVLFSHPEDIKHVNQDLLKTIHEVAKEIGVTVKIGTAITGHAQHVKGKNVDSRHVGGNAFDITEFNGLPALAGTAGGALADKFVERLAARDFKFGEGNNTHSYLWKTMLGGNHFNHLHVSEMPIGGNPHGGVKDDATGKGAERDARKAATAKARAEALARKIEAKIEEGMRLEERAAEILVQRDKKVLDAAMQDLRDTPTTKEAGDRMLAPLQARYNRDLRAQGGIAVRLAARKGEKISLSDWMESRSMSDHSADSAVDSSDDAFLKRAAEMDAYTLERAIKKHGVNSAEARFNAQIAQRSAIRAAAKNETTDPVTIGKLRAGETGPTADLAQQRKDDRIAVNPDDEQSKQVGFMRDRLQYALDNIKLQGAPKGIFALENIPGQIADASAKKAAVQKQVDNFDIPEIFRTDETQKEFDGLILQVKGFSDTIQSLNNRMKLSEYEKSFSRAQKSFDDQSKAVNDAHASVWNVDDAAAYRDDILRLQQLRQVAAKRLEYDQKNLAASDPTRQDKIDAAQRSYDDGGDAITGAQTSYAFGRKRAFQGTINNGAMGFLRQGQSPLTALKGVGDQIVDQILQSQIKAFTDPMATGLTKASLSLEKNTSALDSLNTSLTGGAASSVSGGGLNGKLDKLAAPEVVAAAVTAGALAHKKGGGDSSGSTFSAPGKGSRNKSGRYLAEGAAAYSVFSQGEEQGITPGGILSGAMAGSAFGPWGAVAGGFLSVLGGLFHHRAAVNPTTIGNPVLSLAPGSMDYYAYRYLALRELPTSSQVPGYHNPKSVVNVYMDGIKQAVNTVVAAQTSPITTSRVSSYKNIHGPL